MSEKPPEIKITSGNEGERFHEIELSDRQLQLIIGALVMVKRDHHEVKQDYRKSGINPSEKAAAEDFFEDDKILNDLLLNLSRIQRRNQ